MIMGNYYFSALGTAGTKGAGMKASATSVVRMPFEDQGKLVRPVPQVEDAESAESVPATGGAETFNFEVGFAAVDILQWPTAIRKLRLAHNLDCVVEAGVTRSIDGLEVIEGAENVVMPARRKRQFQKDGFHYCASAVGTKRRPVPHVSPWWGH